MKKISLILSIMLGGCVNQFADNYKTIATTSNPLYIPVSGEIEIKETKDIQGDLQTYLERGYAPIGTSNFSARSGSQNIQNLRNHAKTVGAKAVLINRSNLGSSTITLPFTTPTTTTSQSRSNYNISNNYGGYASVNGNTTTTTYGSQTQYVPVQVSFTQYSAIYLAKFKSRTGIYPVELNNQDKAKIDQNTGFKVGVVVNESPAYYANILPNDIITKINGIDIAGIKGFIEVTNIAPSGLMNIDLIRDSRKLRKQISIE